MQVVELKLILREAFLGIQKCFTDGKHKLGLGEWIETHRKRQDNWYFRQRKANGAMKESGTSQNCTVW